MNKLFMKSALIVCLFITILFGSASMAATKTTTSKTCSHKWNIIERVEPTCIKAGKYTYKCQYCHKTKTEKKSVNSSAHDNVLVLELLATCTQKGSALYRCKLCRKETTITTKALGHDKYISRLAPTCSRSGYSKTICRRCSKVFESYTIPVDESKHVFGEWKSDSLPVAIWQVGYEITESSRCKICGKTAVRTRITTTSPNIMSYLNSTNTSSNVNASNNTSTSTKKVITSVSVKKPIKNDYVSQKYYIN